MTTDVLVVGWGMAGAAAAFELSRSFFVVLVEAEGEMPVHTTGRFTAGYLPALRCPRRCCTRPKRE